VELIKDLGSTSQVTGSRDRERNHVPGSASQVTDSHDSQSSAVKQAKARTRIFPTTTL
jgi:hypothetical protein